MVYTNGFLIFLAAVAPLFFFVDQHQSWASWAFDSRIKFLPPQHTHRLALRRFALLRTQEHQSSTPSSQDSCDDGILPSKQRRRTLFSSAATLVSTILSSSPNCGIGRPEPAAASSLAVLEESENRRIDVFEKNAPSVVFIDTFVEKQDTFVSTTIRMLIMFAIDILSV